MDRLLDRHMCMGLDDDLRDVEEHVAEARRIVHRQKGLAGTRRQFVKYTEPLSIAQAALRPRERYFGSGAMPTAPLNFPSK